MLLLCSLKVLWVSKALGLKENFRYLFFSPSLFTLCVLFPKKKLCFFFPIASSDIVYHCSHVFERKRNVDRFLCAMQAKHLPFWASIPPFAQWLAHFQCHSSLTSYNLIFQPIPSPQKKTTKTFWRHWTVREMHLIIFSSQLKDPSLMCTGFSIQIDVI